MHWTVSSGTLLHLLFCALIVAVNFVGLLVASNDNSDRTDYNQFESKYFGENETYNNDKRMIIEDFYRQSSLAAKAIQEMSFKLNLSRAVGGSSPEHDATVIRNFSTQPTSHYSEGSKNYLWQDFMFLQLMSTFSGLSKGQELHVLVFFEWVKSGFIDGKFVYGKHVSYVRKV